MKYGPHFVYFLGLVQTGGYSNRSGGSGETETGAIFLANIMRPCKKGDKITYNSRRELFPVKHNPLIRPVIGIAAEDSWTVDT